MKLWRSTRIAALQTLRQTLAERVAADRPLQPQENIKWPPALIHQAQAAINSIANQRVRVRAVAPGMARASSRRSPSRHAGQVACPAHRASGVEDAPVALERRTRPARSQRLRRSSTERSNIVHVVHGQERCSCAASSMTMPHPGPGGRHGVGGVAQPGDQTNICAALQGALMAGARRQPASAAIIYARYPEARCRCRPARFQDQQRWRHGPSLGVLRCRAMDDHHQVEQLTQRTGSAPRAGAAPARR